MVYARDGALRYAYRPDGFPWIRLKPGDAIGEAPAPSNADDQVTGMDGVDAESWLERGRGFNLYAQTLMQAGGYATILLLAEPRTREDDDLPRFRK